jgi:lysophospholipase L1-like esterase
MIKELQALPSHPRLILCRPVPAFSESFKIRNSIIIESIIPTLDKLAVELHLPVVDAYNALHDYGRTFPDGIHPDEEGCKVLAESVAEVVRKVATGIARE